MRKNRLLRIIGLGSAILCMTGGVGQAQYRGPQDFHGAVKILIPLPSDYPPVTTDMPWEVLKGYIGLDSMMNVNISQNQIDSIAQAMGDSDSLRWALKYIYEMRDYNPVAFFQELNLFPKTGEFRHRAPRGIVDDALVRAGQAIPDSGRLLMALADVDAIVQITVIDTFCVIDSTKPDGFNTCEGVRSTVDQVIKGHNLPDACGLHGTKQNIHQPTSDPSCIAFQYWRYWTNSINIGGMYTANRGAWLSPGNQYIVFLRFIGLGEDSAWAYATLSPGCAVSTLMGTYPIQSGVVYDPNNDFGFGTGLSVDDFKSHLLQKIQSITSYQ